MLSATERMMVEKQKMEIRRMRMTKEQLELFRDTFVIFDKDGDGTIDSKELSTVLKSMGYNPTKEEIQEMVDEVTLGHMVLDDTQARFKALIKDSSMQKVTFLKFIETLLPK